MILSKSIYLFYVSRKSLVFTIYTNRPGGNRGHEHKTIRFDVVENDPPQCISKSSEQTKES